MSPVTEQEIPLIAQITRMQFQLMHQFLASAGLYPGQFFVLKLVRDNPEGISQKKIGEALCIKPPSVNQIIVNLEKSSLISRTPDTRDKRVMNVQILPKGEEILVKGEEKFFFVQDATIQGISSEDLAVFNRIAERMRDNLKELQ